MSRNLILAALLVSGVSAADPLPTDAPPDLDQQAIGVAIGTAGGGRVTPGGFRVAGHYLYQLSDVDWFDGAASFTFGSGAAGCFRDRDDHEICDHSVASGAGAELQAGIRRYFSAQGRYRPFARLALGVGLARYSSDSVTGLTFSLHGAGGLRARITDTLSITAQGGFIGGVGAFNHSLGAQPVLGLELEAGVEFRL
ncbi:MAG TPA: hypothetical protein VGM88_20400 [Kofleriaceae bacterium]